jgi:hypothetical protein
MNPLSLFTRRPRRPLGLTVVVALAVAIVLLMGWARPASHPATATATVPPAVTGRLIVGLSDGAAGYGGASTVPRLDQILKQGHARWMRDTFWWDQIEPRRNVFRFGAYDHYMLRVASLGMHVIPLLMGTPRWAGSSLDALPADPRTYAGFVTAVLHRYGVKGTFWRQYPKLRSSAISAFELWNEPYFDNGNAGRYDPGRYARMVRAGGTAAHATAPGVKVLMEADMVPHFFGVWRWWVDSLYRALPGLNRYFDGVAVHDYGHDVTHLAPIIAGKPYPNFGRVRRMEDLRRQFLHHGAASKPFWIMEMGWPTCHLHVIDCVTDAQQRANLQTVFGYLQTKWRSWVQAALVYRLQDGSDQNDVYDDYGLVRRNGTAKPARAVFAARAAASPR